MEIEFALMLAAFMFIFGVFIGDGNAHSTVARECERLGSFYVGDKVFECKLKGK